MGRRGGPDHRKDDDWLNQTYGFATVHLGWQPSEFWAATPREFWSAQAVFQRKIDMINKQAEK